MPRLLRRVLLVLVAPTALVLVLFGAFAAWRIPRERAEQERFERYVRRDDGPLVTWVDEARIRIDAIRFDRAAREYRLSSQVVACQDASPALSAIDRNAFVACRDEPQRGEAGVYDAPLVAAVSDVHGHANHLAALLRAHGLVDAADNWAFGRNHLVVAGDVVDKGPETIRALWLVKKLERQALAAGGRVHYLLGNHEHLALNGRSRVPGQKYAEMLASLGQRYEEWFGPTSELGRWIARHPVAVRVNDTLFVHGGISRAVLDAGLSLDQLNRVAAATVRDGTGGAPGQVAERGGLVWGRDGLVSYRGCFDRSFPIGMVRVLRGELRESGDGDLLAAALRRHGARRMVVGHTESRRLASLYGGRLFALCQRMNPEDLVEAPSTFEMLLVDRAGTFRLGLDGRRRPL